MLSSFMLMRFDCIATIVVLVVFDAYCMVHVHFMLLISFNPAFKLY